ncbi:MAG TPA: NAD-dependent epimerase/dehydratase family protein [Leptospiraceae bacterium]|nr:NAD-dependent epimerase/dehydratase family protein [Leptospiraceae bacterium]HNH06872.1 NAD-dependent epimerase/dehydratase family protein [Leptospiraceae bacterium]HNK95099.1 NAD-dependent epimerase/dehydratase family protein [Leptospiraceae bacterium]HNM06258.1 NAD-dependent epimerase/dehydratase family protein [Leptospiraceae bacterium]HNN06519.1 NAD-dependent epimerase/dehydratase family protein [Leptospiraceae bacterium]
MIENRKIFITGGAGFIGSHIIDRLIENNKIVVYDNLHRNAIKFTGSLNHPNLTFIQGDVLDLEKVKSSMKGADFVIHAAAIAGIYSVGVKASNTMKVNLLGTFNVLEACVENNIKRLIDFSTSETYGPFIYKGKESDKTSLGPVGEKRWIYAVSKLAGEHMAHAYADDFGLEVVTVRPFNVYGPRQIGEGAIQQMANRALRNEDITVFNDGTQIRSWCFVTDFADCIVKCLDVADAKNNVFNIGNPQATLTVFGLAEKIIQFTGSKSKINFKPHPGPEVEMRIPDIGKAREILNYEPIVGMDEGLKLAIDWYKQHQITV